MSDGFTRFMDGLMAAVDHAVDNVVQQAVVPQELVTGINVAERLENCRGKRHFTLGTGWKLEITRWVSKERAYGYATPPGSTIGHSVVMRQTGPDAFSIVESPQP